MKYEKGFPIYLPDDLQGCSVYIAGAKSENGKLVTSGGRVLGVTAVSENLHSAIEKAYSVVKTIRFENEYYRNDIGSRALTAFKE